MLDSEHFNDVTVLEFMTEANLSEPKRYLFSVLNEGIYAILIYTYALIYFMIELYLYFHSVTRVNLISEFLSDKSLSERTIPSYFHLFDFTKYCKKKRRILARFLHRLSRNHRYDRNVQVFI
jgi:hypothetical protein